jgi:hypothetical protein
MDAHEVPPDPVSQFLGRLKTFRDQFSWHLSRVEGVEASCRATGPETGNGELIGRLAKHKQDLFHLKAQVATLERTAPRLRKLLRKAHGIRREQMLSNLETWIRTVDAEMQRLSAQLSALAHKVQSNGGHDGHPAH